MSSAGGTNAIVLLIPGYLVPAGGSGGPLGGSGTSGASSASEGGGGASGGGSGISGSGTGVISGSGGSGGSAASGGGSGGSNCHAEGSLVAMADGSERPIETLIRGDRILALELPGLVRDQPGHQPFEWLGEEGDGEQVVAEVEAITIGSHDGLFVINQSYRLTGDHPLLVRRDGRIGFVSAELIEHGDILLGVHGTEEEVESIEMVEGVARTVSISVPGVNTYFVDGVCAHNNTFVQSTPSGLSGATTSATGTTAGGKTSGSSFASGSGSGSASA